MPGYSDPGFDTLALHAGAAPDPATGARAVPIHLTTSFVFESSDHAQSLFNLERAGHVYSRISNPTNAVLEQRVAALEGGIGAISTASGQAALHLCIATLMGAGSHIVASTALYGGSQNLLHYTLRRFGIETTFVKPGDIDGWRAAVRPNTKLFFGETVGNPGLEVLDIPTVSSIAHEAGVPLLVDSTLTSPWLIKPFEHGADLVYHSATKFLSGHGTVVGGIVVDGGSFDWDGPKSAGKFAELTQPYDGFHNMVFTEESSVGAFLLRARREGLRDFGACMSPHTAWLILQGVETLPLRMARHVDNTRKIVGFLAALPWAFLVMPLIDSGSPAAFLVAIAGIFCLFGLSYGPIGAFLPETFATRYRYTGAGLAFNLAGIVGGALPPLVAGALVAAVGSWAVGLLIGGFVLVSIGCTLALPETQGRALAAC